jgi:choline dehydrogenase-like flavoprotein
VKLTANGANHGRRSDHQPQRERPLPIYGHTTATAPMGGPDDKRAVVDAMGAVHGLAGLRVADAPIIPDIPSTPPTSP